MIENGPKFLGLLEATSWVRGPAILGHENPREIEAELADFGKKLDTPECRRLYQYWLERYKAKGRAPDYNNRWHRDLADIAANLYSREWLPGTIEVRYRYVGVNVVDRVGKELTGQNAAEFNPVTSEELWALNGPTFLSGRLLAGHVTYRHLGRGGVHAAIIQLPMTDPESGDIRYSLNAVHYFDPA